MVPMWNAQGWLPWKPNWLQFAETIVVRLVPWWGKVMSQGLPEQQQPNLKNHSAKNWSKGGRPAVRTTMELWDLMWTRQEVPKHAVTYGDRKYVRQHQPWTR